INSRIDNIFVNGVEWFNDHQLKVDEDEKKELKILSQKREIYRQLKLASEKQSDRISSLYFKSKEIQTHKSYLRIKRGKKSKNIIEKVIFFIEEAITKILEKLKLPDKYVQFKNYLAYQSDHISIYLGETNDHGQNWIKPIFLIVVITIAFYPILMITSDPEISFTRDWTSEGWRLFWDKVTANGKAFPQLFNPA